jgi:hypothetical protein
MLDHINKGKLFRDLWTLELNYLQRIVAEFL